MTTQSLSFPPLAWPPHYLQIPGGHLVVLYSDYLIQQLYLGYSVQQYERTARQLEKANLQPEIMVSSILPLEQVGEAIAAIRAGASTLKIHIDPRLAP